MNTVDHFPGREKGGRIAVNPAPRTSALYFTLHFTTAVVCFSPLASSPVLKGFEAGVLPRAPVRQVSQQVRRVGGARSGVLGRTWLDNRPGPKVRTEESSERCDESEKIFTEYLLRCYRYPSFLMFFLSDRRARPGPPPLRAT